VIPLPPLLGGSDFVIWRIDRAPHAESWDSGEGAARSGGRWNARRSRAVYCSLDPATAILEVAVHRGFRVLDTQPHVLTSAVIRDVADVRVVQPEDVPNPHWLLPGIPTAGQQEFGDSLLARHLFVALPSVVSTRSWNLIFDAGRASGAYALRSQERFALDPRLHPAG
jgi:RES domain-containing protein